MTPDDWIPIWRSQPKICHIRQIVENIVKQRGKINCRIFSNEIDVDDKFVAGSEWASIPVPLPSWQDVTQRCELQ